MGFPMIAAAALSAQRRLWPAAGRPEDGNGAVVRSLLRPALYRLAGAPEDDDVPVIPVVKPAAPAGAGGIRMAAGAVIIPG